MKIDIQDVTASHDIAQQFKLSPLCAKVLAAKHMNTSNIEALLKPPVLHDPYDALYMKEVIVRIQQAKQKQEKVLVCGDYDADGICATTILYDALKRFGVSCGFYIPDRFKEGYGLHVNTVRMAAEKGYKLLITVDNGVKAYAALQEAKECKLDVIVSDHHAMNQDEINALYILHPAIMGAPFQSLSGAGVALEISRALLGEVKDHVIFACVAAIADVMALNEETRQIVRLGLRYLQEGYCKVIQALANDRYPKWDETMIAFQIVPKLNAMGRLADLVNVNNMVRYLLLKQHDEIQKVAKQIHKLNDTRKQMSQEMIVTAKELVHLEYPFQMLYHDTFHEGIVGLVAGKLAEELQQPVMVLARHHQLLKGSIRSQGFLDLTSFFDDCMDVLDSYGGHKAAAGIGFSHEHKQHVQDFMNTKTQQKLLHMEPSYKVIAITLSELNVREVSCLRMIAPYGEQFDEPIFYLKDVSIQCMKTMGNGDHVKWVLNDQIEAVWFHQREAYSKWKHSATMSFLATASISQFMGTKKVNLFVKEAF